MQQPPLLPEEVLARVHGIARRNGLSIVLIATIAALLQAMHHDATAAIAALLAAGTGAMELHGAGLLQQGEPRAVKWLVRAELFLLFIVVGYCALRLLHPNLEELRLAFRTTLEIPRVRERWEEAQQAGITEDLYLHVVNGLTYSVLAIVTLAYQGGMAIYYGRRKRAIETALAAE